MRVAAFLIGVVLAAVGGAVAYRALFLDPSPAFIVTDAGRVREMPDMLRVLGGLALLLLGAAIAFFGALWRRK